MTTAAERRFSEPKGLAVLWYGILVGPVGWKLQLVVNYSLVPYACWHDLSILVHAASLLTLLLVLSGVPVAWRSWRRTGEEYETESGDATFTRARFMALSGVALSAFFALVVFGQWIPNVVLSPCDGIP